MKAFILVEQHDGRTDIRTVGATETIPVFINWDDIGDSPEDARMLISIIHSRYPHYLESPGDPRVIQVLKDLKEIANK